MALVDVIAAFFPPEATREDPVSWVDAATDDDEVLAKALASRSATGAFGGGASFADLWTANPDILGQAYPDPSGARAYDASSADAALAQHLAFWAAKDHGQIKRLMLRSGLAREKWRQHTSYLDTTIKKAVLRQEHVYRKPPPQLGAQVAGDRWITSGELERLFAGCVYIADRNQIMLPGGHMYGKERFDVMLGGYMFALDQDKSTKSAWEAFTQSRLIDFPKVHTDSFRPDKGAGEIWEEEGARMVVNTYFPLEVRRVPWRQFGVDLFLNHLAKLFPDEKDYAIVLAYMAAVVQHKGVKFQWCPFIQGVRGNGKTFLSECVIEAVGRAHCYPVRAHEIATRFNDWLEGKIFIGVEDIYVPREREDIIEILKPLITSRWQEIEGKGTQRTSKRICANFILNSNHKDAIRMTDDNRGLAVFFTPQQYREDLARDGMDGAYFTRLYDWARTGGFAAITDYLLTYPIPYALNPATGCQVGPYTSSRGEAIREGLGTLEQEIHAAILEDRVGFRGGWISGYYLTQLVDALGARRIPRNKRRDILRAMGYIPHPGLLRGQAPAAVAPDGCKPVLYVTPDHHSVKLMGIAVARVYSDAQMATDRFTVVLGGSEPASPFVPDGSGVPVDQGA